MIKIAHRGNISGKTTEHENSPAYLNEALFEGYNVEVDVWFHQNRWMTGHDRGQYDVREEFLFQKDIWIHCKNLDALKQLAEISHKDESLSLNFFAHDNDQAILTSKGWLWCYPGVSINSGMACAVMPENVGWGKEDIDKLGFGAVCSDNICSF